MRRRVILDPHHTNTPKMTPLACFSGSTGKRDDCGSLVGDGKPPIQRGFPSPLARQSSMGGWHAHPLVAQWSEQRPSKTWVAGSSPAKGAEALKVSWPRQRYGGIKGFVPHTNGGSTGFQHTYYCLFFGGRDPQPILRFHLHLAGHIGTPEPLVWG